MKKRILSLVLALSMLLSVFSITAMAQEGTPLVQENGDTIVITKQNYVITIDKNGFRYGFSKPDGTVIVDAHQESGICFGKSGGTSYPVTATEYKGEAGGVVSFVVTNQNGDKADVKIHLSDTYVQYEILPIESEEKVQSNLPQKVEVAAESTGESNSLVVKGSGNQVDATVWKLNDSLLPVSDYTVEAKVKLPADGARSAGIYSHFNAQNGFHLFFIKKGQVMFKRLNEDGTSVDFTVSKPIDIKADTWYSLKLVSTGRHFQGYVNGELVIEVDDTAAGDKLITGTAGIRADKMDVNIDDFKVTSNDGKTVYYENNFEATADLTKFKKDFTFVMGSNAVELEKAAAPNKYLELVGNPRATAVTGETGWSNYTVSADMAFAIGDEETNNGLIFGYQDGSNYYGFRFGAAETLSLYKVVDGTETVLKSTTMSYEFDKNYNLKISIKNGLIECFVDGTKKLDATDNTFTAGKAGILTYGTTSKTDNFKVTGASGDLLSADFEDGKLDAWTITGEGKITDGTEEEPDPTPPTKIQYYTIDARLAGGIKYMYGLGDYGALKNTGGSVREDSNVAGVNRLNAGTFTNKDSTMRFISNFSVAPQLGFAQVLFENDDKRVAITDDQTLLGAYKTKKVDGLYYFFGDMRQIYGDYKKVRNAAGYVDTKPHYEMFGLGWEAFGSLGWNAYESSVMSTLQDYLDSGYNLTWAVIGSGFWKGDRKGLEGTTTSFGMWDDQEDPNGRKDGLPNPRFPDPDGIKQFFKDNNMKFLLGLRNHLKLPESYEGVNYGGKWDESVDGNFVFEALKKGYFLKNDDGSLYTVSAKYPTGGIEPRGPVGVIDAENPEAVKWFSDMADLWGVDGFKEDCMMLQTTHNDDNWNKLLQYMAEEKDNVLVVRNASYCLPGDVLRINDANYGTSNGGFNTSPDRMVINSLAYAASGQSNVYPDIIGGTGANISSDAVQNYIVRNAYMAALCPSQSVGVNVLNMNNEERKNAAFKAINWHSTYAPYIYDAALKSYETGYPTSMTPLYIAYPEDENTYGMVNSEKRMFQWLLGESVLATPLFGTDHQTATSRDVYLPEGKWIQYDTGETFEGPITLKDREAPIDQMPAFIGGKGVLVGEDMENKGSYFAEVFPIAEKGSVYDYTFIDGETKSTITNANDGWAPGTLKVFDTTDNKEVTFIYNDVNRSIKFDFEAGHNYELRGGEGTGALFSASLKTEKNSLWIDETTTTSLSALLDDGNIADLSKALISYKSSDSSVASVDDNGVITAKLGGTAEITAEVTMKDNSGNHHTVTSNAVQIEVLKSDVAITAPAAAVINEDFSGELSGWTDHYNGYTVTGGKLSYLNADAAARGTIVANSVVSDDYIIEADVTPTEIIDKKTFGFTFRFQDANNNYLFVYTPGTGIRFLRRVDNKIAQNVTDANFIMEANRTYRFKAVVKGDAFQLYIDGVKVLDVVDNGEVGKLTSGPCGFYTSGQRVEYDNLRIESSVTGFPFDIKGTAQSGDHVKLLFAGYEDTVSLNEDGTWSYPVNHLPRGTIELTAQLLNKAGEVLAETKQNIIVNADAEMPNTDKLSKAIDDAKAADTADTTPATLKAYQEALAEAERILKTQAKQEALDAAADALNQAVSGLAKQANKDALQEIYNSNKDKQQSDYTPNSWTAFEEALNAAKAVIDDENAVQADADKAKSDLEKAAGELKEAADKASLQALYDEHKDKQQSDYTADSFAKFKEALDAAKAVLDDVNAVQADADKAKSDLEKAAGELKEAADKASLQALYDEHKDKQQSDYTADSFAQFKEALDAAKAVLDDVNAVQADADKAKSDLEKAAKALVKAADKSALQNQYNKVKDLKQGNYTDLSWDAFQAALKAAKAVLDDKNAVQQQADDAAKALLEAYENLTEKSGGSQTPGGDSSQSGDNSGGGDTPPTGAPVNLAVWLSVVVVLISGGAVLLLLRKKRES